MNLLDLSNDIIRTYQWYNKYDDEQIIIHTQIREGYVL